MTRPWLTAAKLRRNAQQKHKMQTILTHERSTSGHPDEPSATVINTDQSASTVSVGKG